MGAVKLLGSMLGLVTAVLACHMIGASCTRIAMRWIESEAEAAIVANTVLFSAVWLSSGLMFSAAKKVLHSICLGKLDSMLGSLMLGFMALTASSVALNVWEMCDGASPAAGSGMGVAASVENFAPWLMGYLSSHNF